MTDAQKTVSLGDLAGVFFRIGLFSFGGGVGGWLHRETVTLRSWLTHEEFMAGMALSQVLPGANVSNIAVYIGERLCGGVGAAVALVALLSGPFALILALAWVASLLQGHPLFNAAMDGVAASAVGLVLNIGVVGARRFVPQIVPTGVALATFAAIGFLHWSLIATVGLMAPISVLFSYVRRHAAKV